MPYSLSDEYPPGSRFMGLRLLGTLNLHAAGTGNGLALNSLSGLAYDEDADRLYALSDRGILFHLGLEFDGDELAQVYALGAFPLLDERKRPLRGRLADAEGIVLRNARNGVAGDTKVLVSFERRPRVMVFNPEGALTGAVALTPRLRKVEAYSGRNKGLEAIAVHPHLGVLVAAEQPMLEAPQQQVQIHAIERDITWSFPRPLDPNHGIAALEALPDGSVLTLERAHGFMFVPFITVLRHLPPLSDGRLSLSAGREVARFSTGTGFSLDNFEGLTRHRGLRFLMVSDDNGKPFQASLLSYFEVLEESEGARSGTDAAKSVNSSSKQQLGP